MPGNNAPRASRNDGWAATAGSVPAAFGVIAAAAPGGGSRLGALASVAGAQPHNMVERAIEAHTGFFMGALSDRLNRETCVLTRGRCAGLRVTNRTIPELRTVT